MRPLYLLISASLVPGLLATSVKARDTTVSGSVGTFYELRDRSYKHERSNKSGDDDDNEKFGISPAVTIQSLGVRDSFKLFYSPRLGYDIKKESTTSNHYLNAELMRAFSQRWSASLSNSFVYTDDPQSYSDSTGFVDSIAPSPEDMVPSYLPDDKISDTQAGKKYWNNMTALQSTYHLAEKSTLTSGYSFTMLRNVSGGDSYNEYDRHNVFGNLVHGFNPHWRGNMNLNYSRGLYNQDDSQPERASQNLDQYGAGAGVDYIYSPVTFFPFSYNYSTTEYDDTDRKSSESHQWSLGWDHSLDFRTHITLSVGPSYAKTEGLQGEWTYNATANFSRKYEHALLSFDFLKGYTTQNFTGSDNSGMKDTYELRARLNLQHTQKLSSNYFASYSWDSTLDPQGAYLAAVAPLGQPQTSTTGDYSYDTNEYALGTGLRYSFARWYTLGVNYAYTVSDGDSENDQYTDHRFFFTLSANKDLWHW